MKEQKEQHEESKSARQLLRLKRTSPLELSGEEAPCALVDLRNSGVRSKLLHSLREIRRKNRYEPKKRPK